MAHLPCPVCSSELNATEVAAGICDACAAKLGVITIPPSRRPPIPCPRCSGTTFVHAVPRELSVDTRGTYEINLARHTPMFVTYDVKISRKLLGGNEAVDIDPWEGRGVVEMYVCRGCGNIEWYCFGALPIGPQYMTELIEYEAK